MKNSAMLTGLKDHFKLEPDRIKKLKQMDDLFLQRIFSQDATTYARVRILEVLKDFDRDRALEFFSDVQRRYFDRNINGNRAFAASYVDDVEAMMNKCIDVLREEMDKEFFPEKKAKEKITDLKRFKELSTRKDNSKNRIIDAAKIGYSQEVESTLYMLEPYLKIENKETRDNIKEKMFEIFLSPMPYESLLEIVNAEKRPDADAQEVQEILGVFKSFWEETIDNPPEPRGGRSNEQFKKRIVVARNREDYLKMKFWDVAFTTIDQTINDFSFANFANLATIEELRTGDLEERAYTEEKYEKRTDIRYLIRFIEGLSISDEERRNLLCFYGAKNDDTLSSYIGQLLDISAADSVGVLKKINERVEQNPEIKSNLRKFEFASMDRAAEEMAMVIQKKRLELLFGEDIKREDSDGFFLYRAGPFDEQAESIRARNTDSRKMMATHVGYGSSSAEYETPFLSTTMDPYIAATYMYAQQGKNPDKSAIENPRAQVMVIDCKAMYDIIDRRIEYLHTAASKHMPFEQELLEQLLEVVDNPEFRKRIEERKNEISGYEQYRTDDNLSIMIHPTFLDQSNTEEFTVLRDLIGDSAAYSLKEIGEDRVRKLHSFGKPSFEVTIKSAIPVRYESAVEPGVTTQVTREIDPLQHDFIQTLEGLRPVKGDSMTLTKFIRSNQDEPMIERLGEIVETTMNGSEDSVLSKAEAKFAQMYYIERKPISEIMDSFPKQGKEFEDAQFQIALSEKIREQILEKLTRDPVMSATLSECGVQTYPYVKMKPLVGYGISRTVEDTKTKLRPENMEQTTFHSIEEEGKKVVLGYYESKARNNRSKALEMAESYLKTVSHLRDVEI